MASQRLFGALGLLCVMHQCAAAAPRSTAVTAGSEVQAQLEKAIKTGAPTFALPAGDIVFNRTDFNVVGGNSLEIRGEPSTVLWFHVGSGVRVLGCHYVTLSTFTINYRELPYVQATVDSTIALNDASGNTTYHLTLAPRSASPSTILPRLNLANGGAVWRAPAGIPEAKKVDAAKIIAMVSSCPAPPASGPFPTGTAPCPELIFTKASADGKFTITMATVKPAVRAGDFLTFKASSAHTYVVGNSSGVVSADISIRAASWMAIYEVDGMGANVYRNISIAPDSGYLVGSNADAFHSTDLARGPTLERSTFRNILNDFFSTHSTLHMLTKSASPGHVFELIDPRAWAFGTEAKALVDTFYGTASPMSNVIAGKDTVTCYTLGDFVKVASSVVASKVEIVDEAKVAAARVLQRTLDKAGTTPAIQTWDAIKLWEVVLPAMPHTTHTAAPLVCAVDRFGGAGARITENRFTNGAALLGRTKSTGAVLSGNTWTNTATHSLEITALQPFMEGPVEITDVTIANNTFTHSTDNETSPVHAGPNATHIKFVHNTILP